MSAVGSANAAGEAHPPVPEEMQLVPAETTDRVVAIAASYGEAGERNGRAEAERDVYRERLDEARTEADRLRAELAESRRQPERRRWWRRGSSNG